MHNLQPQHSYDLHWLPENTVEIEQRNLLLVTEKICTSCRYPLLAIRLLIHVIAGIDATGKVHISARHLSKTMNVHYDTVTKCLKYLREIGVMSIEKDTFTIYGKKTYCVQSLIARRTPIPEKVPDYRD